VSDNAFTRRVFEVDAGPEVTFVGAIAHDAPSTMGSSLPRSGTYTRTFEQPGACAFHPLSTRGRVITVDS
jgi:plastocyanin